MIRRISLIFREFNRHSESLSLSCWLSELTLSDFFFMSPSSSLILTFIAFCSSTRCFSFSAHSCRKDSTSDWVTCFTSYFTAGFGRDRTLLLSFIAFCIRLHCSSRSTTLLCACLSYFSSEVYFMTNSLYFERMVLISSDNSLIFSGYPWAVAILSRALFYTWSTFFND